MINSRCINRCPPFDGTDREVLENLSEFAQLKQISPQVKSILPFESGSEAINSPVAEDGVVVRILPI